MNSNISRMNALKEAERVFLVGVASEELRKAEARELLDELHGLAQTLGLETVGESLIQLRDTTPSLLVGTGKAEELVQAADEAGADTIIFDHTLSPVQQRNWEKLSSKKVYDRAELIIKIFASRALTKEASLQVELAQLQYALPRLAHSYDDLMRQRGGRYGTKGSGEQKLELDRREIERRIHEIKDELEAVRKERSVQRRRRERAGVPRAAIVGYTNAGKSSLLNALTAASVNAEDKLFATLDPTTRRLLFAQGQTLLLTDTVGFIRNLPHGLVDAFRSTLEEASQADLLIHVTDASDARVDAHIATTLQVLSDIGARDIARILVLNKIDLAAPDVVDAFLLRYPESVAVSAKTGAGLDGLVEAIQEALTRDMKTLVLRIPHADYRIASLVMREGTVLGEHHDDESTWLRCRIPGRIEKKVQPYIVGEDEVDAGIITAKDETGKKGQK
jgi:GTP-binding protein HflX